MWRLCLVCWSLYSLDLSKARYSTPSTPLASPKNWGSASTHRVNLFAIRCCHWWIAFQTIALLQTNIFQFVISISHRAFSQYVPQRSGVFNIHGAKRNDVGKWNLWGDEEASAVPLSALRFGIPLEKWRLNYLTIKVLDGTVKRWNRSENSRVFSLMILWFGMGAKRCSL